MAKYFIDTEFIEKPCTIQLISIGIKCEDGREYYAISSEFNDQDADNWVVCNVIPKLEEDIVRKPLHTIREELLVFVKDNPEFWGYYADYDWVVFCWLFGRMVDLPNGWPMYCKDLKQLADETGKLRFDCPNSPNGEHNALCDAKWNEDFYNYLIKID